MPLPELTSAYEQYKAALHGREDAKGDYSHPVFGEGPANPLLLFIGEAPGAQEAEQGRPFVGKAGRQLDDMLQWAGIDRASAYVTNAVKYRPIRPGARGMRNRTPDRAERKEGLALLKKEILLLRPRWIATLGNTPLSSMNALCAQELDTVGKAHGTVFRVCVDSYACRLFPLYHPASVIYNPALEPVLKADLHNLGQLCREGV